jgi:aldehyde dehydrogenase (NAD+)
MTEEEIIALVDNQRQYFYTGATLPIPFRIEALKKIKNLLYKYRLEINQAFMADYNKCEMDVMSTEFYMAIAEINYLLKHIKKLARTKKVHPSIVNFPAQGYLMQEPYGVVLIVSPWNYPLQLTLCPLVGAVAAGNTVVCKPSSSSPNVSALMAKMFEEAFPKEYIHFILGGRNDMPGLFDQHFDYIFFTGGYKAGSELMQKAAVHLTPVSLELGGKSPAIVDEDADVDLAAKRLAWGKFLNDGQTCVAPDHFIVHEKVYDEFIKDLVKYIKQFYYVDGKLSKDFCHVINDRQLEKLLAFIPKESKDGNNQVVCGGKNEGRALEPTVIANATWDSPAMQEEIFGPIVPVLKFDNLDKLLAEQMKRPKPLAFYYFTKDKKKAKRVMHLMPFGGGCINNAIMHMTSDSMPFGGVGRSGMGSYHGDMTFKTFSHQKSVLYKGHAELPLAFPPYTDTGIKLMKILSGVKKDKK